jgi:hypothetical protein
MLGTGPGRSRRFPANRAGWARAARCRRRCDGSRVETEQTFFSDSLLKISQALFAQLFKLVFTAPAEARFPRLRCIMKSVEALFSGPERPLSSSHWIAQLGREDDRRRKGGAPRGAIPGPQMLRLQRAIRGEPHLEVPCCESHHLLFPARPGHPLP